MLVVLEIRELRAVLVRRVEMRRIITGLVASIREILARRLRVLRASRSAPGMMVALEVVRAWGIRLEVKAVIVRILRGLPDRMLAVWQDRGEMEERRRAEMVFRAIRANPGQLARIVRAGKVPAVL